MASLPQNEVMLIREVNAEITADKAERKDILSRLRL